MTLDSRFIIASDLQSVFVDKDTGEPLAGGKLKFFKDRARTTPKDVYKLSGSPPNYSYTNLGNEITLTIAGTVGDGDGNDIILYYFPYDGTEDDSNGDVELYFVRIEDADEVPQFTREAWPNFTLSQSSQILDTTNYIPNGQFLIHNDIPAIGDNVAGQITEAITTLAQGGWTFERPVGSTATDIVTFDKFTYTENPSSNPPYAFHLETQIPNSGDDYKDLRIKFDGVNQFSSDTQQYTFGIEAVDDSGNGIQVSLVLIKNYGTGGSTQTEDTLKTWTLTSSYRLYQYSFVFGANDTKTIGPDGDDFVQLAVRFRVDQIQDISVTNIQLRPNAVTLSDFKPITEREVSYETLTAPVPAYDGSNLYLPVKLGPKGLIYDTSEIGDVVMESNVVNYTDSISTVTNRLLADGSQYETDALSPLNIPYSRLQNYYWSYALNAPIYGTGSSYLTMYPNGTSSQMRVSTNSAGAAANATDGTPSTTFTFNNIHVGTTNYGWSAKSIGSNSLFVIANAVGTAVTVGAGTSGFTVTSYRQGSAVKGIAQITTIVPASLAGTYFTLNFGTAYYIWFKLDGAGSDPAPGGTGIEVDLLSTYTAQDVADVLTEALNAVTQTNITLVAGSSVVAGSYFNISTATTNYYVWYKKDGNGTDPAPSNKTAIGPILVLTADTAATVAVKTQQAINQKYFSVPNYQGLFPRGYDPNSLYDTDYRWSSLTNYYGATTIGTSELDALLQHFHTYTDPAGSSGSALAGGSGYVESTDDTGSAGSLENRPHNFNANFAIKY
jgi:hypothetical protein